MSFIALSYDYFVRTEKYLNLYIVLGYELFFLKCKFVDSVRL